MVAGKNTVANFLFELSGINNVAKDINGYKIISNEMLAQQSVDLIFIPSHNTQKFCQESVLMVASKGKCAIHKIDGLLLLGLTTRLDEAVRFMIEKAQRIHNNL